MLGRALLSQAQCSECQCWKGQCSGRGSVWSVSVGKGSSKGGEYSERQFLGRGSDEGETVFKAAVLGRAVLMVEQY